MYAPWKLSAEIRVSSITLTLLLLAWLPLLVPWIISVSPRLQKLFTGLRGFGIEEIEIGILRIKLGAGVEKAADAYANSVLKAQPTDPSQDIQKLESSYNEAVKMLKASKLEPHDAMSKIDELCLYYDRIRESKASSSERTRLMTAIASTMWSLMPSIPNFPARERLNSAKGGERLSAYKFLEYQPNPDCLEPLLARAIGVLELPFGQYHALLALSRVVLSSEIGIPQRKLLLQTLNWNSQLEFLRKKDRGSLMKLIISALEQTSPRADS
jgi:hypothetical protein